MRVIADALALPGLAARHEVEFAVVFGKPDWRADGDPTLAESCQADVMLAVNFGWNRSHTRYCKSGRRIAGCKNVTLNFRVLRN